RQRKKPSDPHSLRYRERGPSPRPQAGRFYDRRPLVAFGAEEGGDLLWRGDLGVDAELDQGACDLRRLQARIDGGVESVDDRAGRASGRDHAGERDRGEVAMPASIIVGTSGICELRRSLVEAS